MFIIPQNNRFSTCSNCRGIFSPNFQTFLEIESNLKRTLINKIIDVHQFSSYREYWKKNTVRIFINPSTRGECDTRSISKEILISLNSVFFLLDWLSLSKVQYTAYFKSTIHRMFQKYNTQGISKVCIDRQNSFIIFITVNDLIALNFVSNVYMPKTNKQNKNVRHLSTYQNWYLLHVEMISSSFIATLVQNRFQMILDDSKEKIKLSLIWRPKSSFIFLPPNLFRKVWFLKNSFSNRKFPNRKMFWDPKFWNALYISRLNFLPLWQPLS